MPESHIVALSGGKDSSAMALRLAELYPLRPFEYVITPTGNELPDMVPHWKRLSELLGAPLKPLTSKSLAGEIRRQRMLPNFRARFCTRILKIEPYEEHLVALSQMGPVHSYVGLRADEPEVSRMGGLYGHIPGVSMHFPMREWGWGVGDVRRYLEKRGVQVPRRTDCAMCYHQRIGEWWNLWKEHPEAFNEAAELEAEVRAEREREHTLRSPERDSWPASLGALGEEFARGRRPAGAGQLALIEDPIKDTRCRVCSL